MKSIIDENIPLASHIRPGHYNDMDMLEVGRIVGAPQSSFVMENETGLTRREEATHFGLWCFLSSPLLIGCDARKIDAETRQLVTNPFLLAMNQNDLGAEAKTILRKGETYILVKDCETIGGPSRFLALYNGGEADHEFAVEFYALDLAGQVAVFELGERADLGVFTHEVRMSVPPHGARFFRLDAERRR